MKSYVKYQEEEERKEDEIKMTSSSPNYFRPLGLTLKLPPLAAVIDSFITRDNFTWIRKVYLSGNKSVSCIKQIRYNGLIFIKDSYIK